MKTANDNWLHALATLQALLFLGVGALAYEISGNALSFIAFPLGIVIYFLCWFEDTKRNKRD